jgi:succinoglycan biosynthesis protein ExoL
MRVLLLMPVASQPRYLKRIAGLQANGVDCRALYFDRDYFRGAVLPCPSRSFGRLPHGNYLARVARLSQLVFTSRGDVRDADVVYAFGFDMALFALMCGARRVVYEIADIRPLQLVNGLVGSIVRTVDRILCRRACAIVVTAKGYADGYLAGRLGIKRNNVLVIENRVDLPVRSRPAPRPRKPGQPIVIGYFGLIRCEKSWRALDALATRGNGMIRVVVRGFDRGVGLTPSLDPNPFITYGGEYVVPDDLHELYGQVDIVWACYPAPVRSSEQNWKWARTNRFYESCYFRKPMVTLAGSDESKEVVRRGIGIDVDLSDPEALASLLVDVLPRDLHQWQNAAAMIPDLDCVYADEHTELARMIFSQAT